jgi:hypothetical protein
MVIPVVAPRWAAVRQQPSRRPVGRGWHELTAGLVRSAGGTVRDIEAGHNASAFSAIEVRAVTRAWGNAATSVSPRWRRPDDYAIETSRDDGGCGFRMNLKREPAPVGDRGRSR